MSGPRFGRILAKAARRIVNIGTAATGMRGGNEILTVFLERRLTETWLLDDQ